MTNRVVFRRIIMMLGVFVVMLILAICLMPTHFSVNAETGIDDSFIQYEMGLVPGDGSVPDNYPELSQRTDISIPSTRDLPSSVDLSLRNTFPTIGDQGQNGSCSAWATTYYQFTFQVAEINSGAMIPKLNEADRFSPWQLYVYLNHNDMHAGTPITSYYDLLKEIGCVRYNEYNNTQNSIGNWAPNKWFDITDDSANETAYERYISALMTALKTRVTSWTKEDFGVISYNPGSEPTCYPTPITSNTDSDLDVMKGRLNAGQVLVVGILSGNNFQSYHLHFDSSKNLYYIPYFLNYGNSGHAVCIVGYNDNIWFDLNNNGIAETNEYGAFKIANSWGTGWGNYGYIWVSYDALNGASSDSSLNYNNRIRAFSGNSFYSITVDTFDPELVAEVSVTQNNRTGFGFTLYRKSGTNVTGFPFFTGKIACGGISGTWPDDAEPIPTDYNGNTESDIQYDERIFVFDFSNTCYYSAGNVMFDGGENIYDLKVQDWYSNDGSNTTVNYIKWKNGAGEELYTDLTSKVLNGASKEYYYGEYIINASSISINQDARRVQMQLTAPSGFNKMKLYIGDRYYYITKPSSGNYDATVNGDHIKIVFSPITIDYGAAYTWNIQIKLSSPTISTTSETVRAEFVYSNSFIIPSAVVNGCVFWNSYIKTGISVGTTAEYLVNAYEGVYNIYQCDLVNGVTFETIDYDDTTIAATGMIILQKHNGKIANIIYLIIFGDLAGGGTIGDGIIHVDDALAALRHYAGTGIITYEAFFLAADIDHDGYVTNTDANAILSAVGSPSNINQNHSITTVPDGLYYQIPVAFV